jgi:hypothetical protein
VANATQGGSSGAIMVTNLHFVAIVKGFVETLTRRIGLPA